MDEGIRMVSMLVQKQSNDLRPSILDGIGGCPSLFVNSPLTQHMLQPQKAQTKYVPHYVDSRSNIGLCVCNLHPSSPLRL